MFKKLISNLPFNPSLITELAFYSKRVHTESSVRRLGFMFIALAMVVQMFAVISPPEPTLASSSNDVIRDGFNNRDEATMHCLGDTQGFRDVLTHYGVDCDIIARAETVTLNSRAHDGNLDSMGRNPVAATNPKNGKQANQYSVQIGGTTFYMKNFWYWDTYSSSNYQALKMINKHGNIIYILYDCGNIVTIGKYSPPPPPPAPAPTPTATPNSKPSASFNANCSSIVWRAVDPDGSPRVRLYIGSASDNPSSDWSAKGSFVHSVSGKSSGTSNDGSWEIPLTYKSISSRYRVFVVVSDKLPGGSMDNTNFVRATPTEGIVFGPCLESPPPPEQPPAPEPEVPEVVDVCPNIDGAQTNYEQCDVCPNIPETQSSIEECYACPEAETDDSDAACLEFNKTARNETQILADANNTEAHAEDIIEYTLSVSNTGKTEFVDFRMQENLNDVLEYANVVDLDGGTLNEDDGIVTWPATTIAAGQTLKKVVIVQVKKSIPQTPASTSDPGSYDLTMTNVYYDKSISISLPSSPQKQIEIVSKTLPNTGPGETLAVGFVIVTIAGYFLARSRLMGQELEIIKQEYSTGA